MTMQSARFEEIFRNNAKNYAAGGVAVGGGARSNKYKNCVKSCNTRYPPGHVKAGKKKGKITVKVTRKKASGQGAYFKYVAAHRKAGEDMAAAAKRLKAAYAKS